MAHISLDTKFVLCLKQKDITVSSRMHFLVPRNLIKEKYFNLGEKIQFSKVINFMKLIRIRPSLETCWVENTSCIYYYLPIYFS